MKYYATIYIKTMQVPSLVPHTFLGLTKENPDKLGKQEIEIQKYKDDYLIGGQFLVKTKGEWYENIYPSILSDDFQGEGFWGFGPESKVWKSGKVFENNQYNHEPYENIEQINDNSYKKTDIRSSSTFQSNNRCVFEISKEQYERLLELIKQDVLSTLYINKNSDVPVTQELKYDLTSNNCTTWALHKLDSIGIEVFNIKEWIPDIPIFDDLKELFPYLKFCNTIFQKFQAIDSNLESIKGAKAFRTWARTMIDNIYFYALKCDDRKNECRVESKKIAMDAPAEIILWKTKAYKLFQVYRRLNELNLIKTLMQYQTTGKFLFIYNDKSKDDKKFILDPLNNYEPQHIDELDLSIPANNFSANEFYPFIFISDDNYLSNALYHQYHYAIMSENYVKDTMTFYFGFLEGKEIKDYWSESYHAINKRVQNECELA